MQAFMKEDVQFDMPAGHTGWSQSVSVSVTGNVATKTVTRTINLEGGKSTALTVTQERTFK